MAKTTPTKQRSVKKAVKKPSPRDEVKYDSLGRKRTPAEQKRNVEKYLGMFAKIDGGENDAKSEMKAPIRRGNKKTIASLDPELYDLLKVSSLAPVKKDSAFKRRVRAYCGILKDMNYSSEDFIRDKKKEIELENR